MLTFKQFLEEEFQESESPESRHIGYGNDPHDFYDYLSAPSHTFKKKKILGEDLEDTSFKHLRDGFSAAFPEGEQDHERKAKHKEAISNWSNFKKQYEIEENKRRESENNDINRANDHVEGRNRMSDDDITKMLSSHTANRAHNILARAHARGDIKLSDEHIHHILDNPNASDAHKILETSHVKRDKSGSPSTLNSDHVKKLENLSIDGKLKAHNVNANVFQERKQLNLGGGRRITSSNGKYDPEKHVEDTGKKKVKILGVALSPHTVAGGINNCPKSTHSCRKACLALRSGMNQGEERNYHLKVARSRFMQQNPEHYMRMLSGEMDSHEKSSKKKGYEPAARINANSDINIEHAFPQAYWDRHKGIRHYDYTKIAGRMNSPKKLEDLKNKNYHLTLSHSGTNHAESNDTEVAKHLKNGGNVAMVFRTRHKDKIPHSLLVHHEDGSISAHPVHNANDRDDRYNDAEHHARNEKHEEFLKKNPHIKRGMGMVSGLTFKGNTDEEMQHSNFPVDVDEKDDHITSTIKVGSHKGHEEGPDWRRRIPIKSV